MTRPDENEPPPCTGPSITTLISCYPILGTLASWISARDLRRLGRTSRTHHAHILASPLVFKALTRQSTCSGLGLILRQKQEDGIYRAKGCGRLSVNPHMDSDAEIEVRLYNVACDEAGALPCVGCGVNICEECRYYRRAAPASSYPDRRPHLNSPWQTGSVLAFCDHCDEGVEQEVRAKNYINELCECDAYTRWRCKGCHDAEEREAGKYQSEHTKIEFDWDFGDDDDYPATKIAQDHQFSRAFWCPCGGSVPEDQRFRCAWCKRRHLPESEWGQEWDEIGRRLPFFENDPNYPQWQSDADRHYPNPYPKLGYDRPAHLVEDAGAT